MNEATLNGHLENTNGKGDLEGQPTKPEAAASASDGESPASLANTDYVLFEALNLLRGMAIFNQAM